MVGGPALGRAGGAAWHRPAAAEGGVPGRSGAGPGAGGRGGSGRPPGHLVDGHAVRGGAGAHGGGARLRGDRVLGGAEAGLGCRARARGAGAGPVGAAGLGLRGLPPGRCAGRRRVHVRPRRGLAARLGSGRRAVGRRCAAQVGERRRGVRHHWRAVGGGAGPAGRDPGGGQHGRWHRQHGRRGRWGGRPGHRYGRTLGRPVAVLGPAASGARRGLLAELRPGDVRRGRRVRGGRRRCRLVGRGGGRDPGGDACPS